MRLAWALALLSAGTANPPAAATGPVLVELFTSEGCSSCPPADELLARLQKEAGTTAIVLSEHVDYWDGLGWRDSFSSARFTERQQLYSRRFHLESVYTPQMVVDGSVEFVGGNSAAARAAIQKAAQMEKTPISLSDQGGVFRVEIPAARTASVMLAVVTGEAASQVSRGENAGRTLRHTAVVREMRQIGTTGSKPIIVDIPAGALRRGDRMVVFLQEPGQGRVIGAAALPTAAGTR